MGIYINLKAVPGITLPALTAPRTSGICGTTHKQNMAMCTMEADHGSAAHVASIDGYTVAIWHDDYDDHYTSWPIHVNSEVYPVEVYPEAGSPFRATFTKVPGCGKAAEDEAYMCNSHVIQGWCLFASDQLYMLEKKR